MTLKPKIAYAACAVTLLGVMPAQAAPLSYPPVVVEVFPRPPAPNVTAQSWLLYDESSDIVLASFLPDQERAMASTTKIMTALLAFEQGDMSDVVTISRRAVGTGERSIGLVAEERLTLGALVRAAMIHSANDASTAIAEHIGGSLEGFVVLMNQRAARLGMTGTRFANPHGLDAPNHHSTAADLLELSRAAMEYEGFRDVVRARIVVFPDNPDGTRRIGTSTNLMIGDYEGASGIKTGFTSRALLTFVATAEREGRRLYSVTLGSPVRRSQFIDAEKLFDYGFEDLGIYGNLSAGTRYTPQKPRTAGPLELGSDLEAFVHLSSQGLTESQAPDERPTSEVVPRPITVTIPKPAAPATTMSGLLGYWRDQINRGSSG